MKRILIATVFSGLVLVGCIQGKGGDSSQKIDGMDLSCDVKGKVVKVVDGDTAYVLDAEKIRHSIRFKGVDAPEWQQAYGRLSKQFVSRAIAGREVCVAGTKRDRWNRLIGYVFAGGKVINLEVVKAGLAWHYKGYEKEQTPAERRVFSDAEAAARKSGLGLWNDLNPMAPWDYRKKK